MMLTASAIYNAIGLCGMMCFLVAYFLLQRGKLRAEDVRYSYINLAGAVLLLISFIDSWNLPAFLLEVVWSLISLYGIVRWYKENS